MSVGQDPKSGLARFWVEDPISKVVFSGPTPTAPWNALYESRFESPPKQVLDGLDLFGLLELQGEILKLPHAPKRKASIELKRGDVVAIRADPESGDKVWLARVSQDHTLMLKNYAASQTLTVQWFESTNGINYSLHDGEDDIEDASIFYGPVGPEMLTCQKTGLYKLHFDISQMDW